MLPRSVETESISHADVISIANSLLRSARQPSTKSRPSFRVLDLPLRALLSICKSVDMVQVPLQAALEEGTWQCRCQRTDRLGKKRWQTARFAITENAVRASMNFPPKLAVFPR